MNQASHAPNIDSKIFVSLPVEDAQFKMQLSSMTKNLFSSNEHTPSRHVFRKVQLKDSK
jgi:hypothetical protein